MCLSETLCLNVLRYVKTAKQLRSHFALGSPAIVSQFLSVPSLAVSTFFPSRVSCSYGCLCQKVWFSHDKIDMLVMCGGQGTNINAVLSFLLQLCVFLKHMYTWIAILFFFLLPCSFLCSKIAGHCLQSKTSFILKSFIEVQHTSVSCNQLVLQIKYIRSNSLTLLWPAHHWGCMHDSTYLTSVYKDPAKFYARYVWGTIKWTSPLQNFLRLSVLLNILLLRHWLVISSGHSCTSNWR